jgi:DNA-binding transcriptional LysR family regulator
VEDDAARGKLQQIALPELDLRRDFYLVTAKKRSLPHHYQVFLETLQRSFDNVWVNKMNLAKSVQIT